MCQDAPDLNKFPRFETHAVPPVHCVVGKGDVLYLPALWYGIRMVIRPETDANQKQRAKMNLFIYCCSRFYGFSIIGIIKWRKEASQWR